MMQMRFTLIYWMNEDRWHGKLMEHPHIRAEAGNLDELQEQITATYLNEVMADVPQEYAIRTLVI